MITDAQLHTVVEKTSSPILKELATELLELRWLDGLRRQHLVDKVQSYADGLKTVKERAPDSPYLRLWEGTFP